MEAVSSRLLQVRDCCRRDRKPHGKQPIAACHAIHLLTRERRYLTSPQSATRIFPLVAPDGDEPSASTFFTTSNPSTTLPKTDVLAVQPGSGHSAQEEL